MDSKFKRVLSVGIVVVLTVVAGFYINGWVRQKMQKVELGLAELSFPYRDYTAEELGKLYPQYLEPNADVSTRITPEETYAKFRQALKENNLEMAIDQLYSESEAEVYENYLKKNDLPKTNITDNLLTTYYQRENKDYKKNVKTLTNAYNEGRFVEAGNAYPTKIRKVSMENSKAEYEYDNEENGKVFVNSIRFSKNANGDWKLDSL